MGRIKDNITSLFNNALQKVQPVAALKEAIEKNEDAIMDINRAQLDRGQDAQGKSLGKYKNFDYKGRFEPVDLKLTGEFRRKFTLAVDDRQTIIFSQDHKEKWLEKRYGKNIFGVQKNLLPRMADIIRPDFEAAVKRSLEE